MSRIRLNDRVVPTLGRARRRSTAAVLFWVLSGTLFASAQTTSPSVESLQRIRALRQQLPALARRVEGIRKSGQDVSYPLVTLQVLEDFVAFAERDLTATGEHQRWLRHRGDSAAADLEQLAT